MTDASVRIYPFLSKLKIPFYVFTCVLLFLAVLFPLLNTFLGLRVVTAITAMYAAIALGFLIFYIVTVVKVMRRLSMSTKKKEKSRNLREVSLLLFLAKMQKKIDSFECAYLCGFNMVLTVFYRSLSI